jgi:dTDP-L-rhamnose 4-epimerase
MNILITGGAGFIGTHLTRTLLAHRHAVTVFDNLLPQVHGSAGGLAPDVRDEVESINGDVRDKGAFHSALLDKDIIVHLAAETGTGQSMYDVLRYNEVNIGGTAVLMDFLTNDRRSRIQKIIVASSRAIYGEGKYRCAEHGVVYPAMRAAEAMKEAVFEPLCPNCKETCSALPTDESAPYQPSSMYGLTKQVQEQMVLLYARSLGLSAYALRYQNVYGPGQSLRNPYTGILAIFSNLARQGKTIRVFEDGLESRDFVHVADVARLTAQAVQPEYMGVEAVNVGSGVATTVADVARAVVEALNSRSRIEITGEFRVGDIRHNTADLRRARELFAFEPRWALDTGLQSFLQWSLREEIEPNGYEDSLAQLAAVGLYHRASG